MGTSFLKYIIEVYEGASRGPFMEAKLILT
jgi:hypothetical protein